MTVDVIVERPPGDNPGEDIVDPLITDISVALSRGQVEVDKVAKGVPVTLQTKFRAGLRTGQLIEVVDALMGVAWRGKITGIEHGVDGPVLITTLQVVRHD